LPVSLYDADVRQVAIFLRIVGTVSGHEHVTDAKPDIIELDLDSSALRLVEQRAGPEVADPAPGQQSRGTGDGSAGVDNVVDEQHPPPRKIGGDVGEKTHFAAAFFGKAVAGELHELDL